ncbi:MAG: hypothetical protein ABSE79_14890 [Terriglobia bacterium]|jgi:hypothetical protein
MSSHGSDISIAAVVGFGAGLFWFIKGFRVFREYRVLADTPEIPIRSVAMGLVEIHGKAKGLQTVLSPVSNTPCFFYKVDIERWVSDKNGGHWSHAATQAEGTRFYLEDASGKVLVDAHGAEYDLIQTAKRETGRGFGGSLGRLFGGSQDPTLATGSGVSDADLLNYAQAVISTGRGSFSLSGGSLLSGLRMGSAHRYRLCEYCILPEQSYDVAGTCIENPDAQDEHDRNMIVKGQNEPTFVISWRSEKELKSRLRNRAALHILGGAALSVVCLAVLLFRFGWL